MPKPFALACALAVSFACAAPAWAGPDAPAKKTGKKAPQKKPKKKKKFKSWYPKKIKPPKGTKYPCKMSALPKGMLTFPKADRHFIDHAFGMILKSTWAKLKVMETWRVMDKRKGNRKLSKSKLKRVHATYRKKVLGYVKKLKAEPTPNKTLKSFRDLVVKALELQLKFFKAWRDKVIELPHPQGYNSLGSIPEGKTASGLLIKAWGVISKHYKKWPKAPKTKDAVFHHLCALDLY